MLSHVASTHAHLVRDARSVSLLQPADQLTGRKLTPVTRLNCAVDKTIQLNTQHSNHVPYQRENAHHVYSTEFTFNLLGNDELCAHSIWDASSSGSPLHSSVT
jgi:hypothetical protein